MTSWLSYTSWWFSLCTSRLFSICIYLNPCCSSKFAHYWQIPQCVSLSPPHGLYMTSMFATCQKSLPDMLPHLDCTCLLLWGQVECWLCGGRLLFVNSDTPVISLCCEINYCPMNLVCCCAGMLFLSTITPGHQSAVLTPLGRSDTM